MACSKDQVFTSPFDIEEDLTCSICLDLYDDPVSLPCQHNFCRNCIRSHLQQKSDIQVLVTGTQHGRFPCPTCRDSVELTDADINNLPKNFGLQSIVLKFQSLKMEKMENETRSTAIEETECKHHGKPLMMYCDTCEEAMCIECIPIRSHENHTIVQFTEKVKSYQEDVERTVLPQIIELQESLREMKAGLTSNRQESQDMLQINIKEVAETFQELRSAVNQKESELMFVFESKKQELDSKYESQTEGLNERLETVEDLHTKFSTLTFQDPAKSIQEIKSGKERLEEASREDYSENVIQLLGDVKDLEVLKQIHGLNDDMKRVLSDVNNIEIGKTGDNGAETAPPDCQTPWIESTNAEAAYLTTDDTVPDPPERRKVKIVDPKTGKDISSEIYKRKQRTLLPEERGNHGDSFKMDMRSDGNDLSDQAHFRPFQLTEDVAPYCFKLKVPSTKASRREKKKERKPEMKMKRRLEMKAEKCAERATSTYD